MVSKSALFVPFLLIPIAGVFLLLARPDAESFRAPGHDWNSPKRVEDYFMEKLRMSAQEAKDIRGRGDGKVNVRINANTTLAAVTGNLYYYGFVRDEDSLLYALEHTQDTTPSNQAIKVGSNGSIDTNAEYRISEDMSAWEIADTLLNKPTGHFSWDEYGNFFMP